MILERSASSGLASPPRTRVGRSDRVAVARRVLVPGVRRGESLARAGAADALPLRGLWTADLGHRGHDLAGHADPADHVVSRHAVGDQPTHRSQCQRSPAGVGAGELRDGVDVVAQIASGAGRSRRDLSRGAREGVRGRQTEKKALIAVAVEEAGLSYDRLEKHGYRHRITLLKGRKESAAELLPRVHRVVSLLKRWLLGTHQGAVSPAHLEYDLDEFTFRFNRRTSRHRGKLFHRLVSRPSRSIRRPTRHWSSTCGLDAQGGVGGTRTNSRHLSQGDTTRR